MKQGEAPVRKAPCGANRPHPASPDIGFPTSVAANIGTGWSVTTNDAQSNYLRMTIQAVPEPSTYAIVLGSLGCGAIAYRRRRFGFRPGSKG